MTQYCVATLEKDAAIFFAQLLVLDHLVSSEPVNTTLIDHWGGPSVGGPTRVS